MKILTVLGLALATLSATVHAGPVNDQRFRELAEEAFRRVIDRYDLPGIAVGVTLGGRHPVFTEGIDSAQQARSPALLTSPRGVGVARDRVCFGSQS